MKADGPRMLWYEPASGRRRLTIDHGADVMDDPHDFGIDDDTADRMDAAFGDGTGYDGVVDASSLPDELDPAIAWGADDAWEQMAMNRGWVRISPCPEGVGMSARDVALVRAGVRHLLSRVRRLSLVELEVCGDRGGVIDYVEMRDAEIRRFASGSDAEAAATVAAKGRKVERARGEGPSAGP